MDPAACAADIRPMWQVNAATKRINMPMARAFKKVALKNDLIPGSASSMIMAGLLPRLVTIEACPGQFTNQSGRCEGVSFVFGHHRSLEKGATSKLALGACVRGSQKPCRTRRFRSVRSAVQGHSYGPHGSSIQDRD